MACHWILEEIQSPDRTSPEKINSQNRADAWDTEFCNKLWRTAEFPYTFMAYRWILKYILRRTTKISKFSKKSTTQTGRAGKNQHPESRRDRRTTEILNSIHGVQLNCPPPPQKNMAYHWILQKINNHNRADWSGSNGILKSMYGVPLKSWIKTTA